MTTDHAELLSAFMDGEAVEPAALARALDDPDARRALVAFASVRQGLHAPAPGEGDWVVQQGARLAGPRRAMRPWSLAAAAAVLTAAIGAGMVAERARTREAPPQPARVVELEPLPADMRVR